MRVRPGRHGCRTGVLRSRVSDSPSTAFWTPSKAPDTALAGSRAVSRLPTRRATGYRGRGKCILSPNQARGTGQSNGPGVNSLSRARQVYFSSYQQGVASLIEVLQADESLLRASDSRAQAQTESARAAVAAFKALGGAGSP